MLAAEDRGTKTSGQSGPPLREALRAACAGGGFLEEVALEFRWCQELAG